MIDAGYVQEMAAYNAWQNGAEHGLCDALEEAERQRDRGLFFGSPHRTLDHIAMVDRWILDTLEGVPAGRFDPSVPVHADWPALQAARADLDTRIEAMAARATRAWLDEAIEVHSTSLNRLRRIPRALYLMQMFNHATHHRSQATTALHAMGMDHGCTDLPFRPGTPF